MNPAPVKVLPVREFAEERFRIAVESSPSAMVMVDAEGRVLLVNQRTEEMFGYSRNELLGNTVEVLVPERFRGSHPDYRREFMKVPQARHMGRGRDLYGRRKDGTEFPIEIGLNPIVSDVGNLVLSAIVDITERKKTEEALKQSKENLERVVSELQAKNDEVRMMTQQLWQAAKLASVGELAASIAHELNNPLATISLRMESLLAKTPEDDPRRKSLQVVAQESHRMGELVANLLQFSRRNDGQISTVDIRDEIANAIDLIHQHLRKRQVAVVKELAAATPIIYADRQKLRQMFLNLLSNAGDAMPQGGKLTVRTTPMTLSDGKAAVKIEFADTGVGIPGDLLDKVMDPFFTTKAEGQGTGLGLAICKRIVQEHQGSIQIQSEIRVGTTVAIVLPVTHNTNPKALGEARGKLGA